MRLMKNALPAAAIAAVSFLCLRAAEAATSPHRKVRPTMNLTSAVFQDAQPIPKKFTGEGDDVSPPLAWSGIPSKAKSLALIVDDPDAPMGTWIHWVIYNIPAKTTGLPENVPKSKEKLPDGALQGLAWGVEGNAQFPCSRVGYGGPMPPPGLPHRYFFKLYALDEALSSPRLTKAALMKAMKGHLLAEAQIIGTYQR